MTTNVIDRVVRWNLDLDGDLYGDERERFRWYEGIAASSSLQSVLVPGAAAVMVWPLGRAAVPPLAVILVLQWLTMLLATLYVRRRRVDTVPRSWNLKRLVLTVLGVGPYVVFLVGALHAYDPAGDTWIGAAVGGVLGGTGAIIGTILKIKRRDQREALVGDDD
ncbi:hypothetical protein GCM10010172_37080 [Paractinoplanes ferrugineus]|uniref:DUF2029 domain-containing protein n=1 Tax=Paractinoplanes ferrugineus TaxID=113564 RepID=A0A919IVM3_9ACTN|nr:hypothetical protein [Actinoplanes ferrugineus]GIE09305.1 hypothetical protein Afe05nite_11450 [Actinoplanes ferrugineus]